MVSIQVLPDGRYCVSRILPSLPSARDAVIALRDINPAKYATTEPVLSAESPSVATED